VVQRLVGVLSVADLWAERIAAEHGIEVRVADHASGGLSAGSVLRVLEMPEVQAEVREAEAILVYGKPDRVGAGGQWSGNLHVCRPDPA
jgi:hypothetical protein